MVRKALILAAGLGTRLRPITETLPKAMIPVLNRPIMEYTLALCLNYGLKEVIINLHYFPELITSYFGQQYHGLTLQYSYEKELLENAGAVANVKNFFNQEELFLVIASDNIADFDLTAMTDFHKQKKALATIATTTALDPSKYGIAAIDNHQRITLFQEKPRPEEAKGDQVATCCYLFSSEIFDFIPPGQSVHFGKQIFPQLLQAQKPLYAFKHHGYWNDVGNPTNYYETVRDLLDAKLHHPLVPTHPIRSLHHTSARIKNSTIEPYTTIDAQSTIHNSTLARSLIFAQTQVKNSILTDCIISKKCTIENCHLTHAVVAENCSLKNVSLDHATFQPNTILNNNPIKK